jgi:aspartate aminotransferase
MPHISTRGRAMPASPIRRLVPLADAARRRGVHVHGLNIGQPDVPTPRGIIEAYQAYDAEVLSYGPSQGLPELRDKVAHAYRELDLDIDAEHVQVTFGGSEAVQFALTAACDPGDEVLVSEPFYANYNGFAVASGVQVRAVSADPAGGFRLPPDSAFEAAMSDRTRALLLCSPGNPTGTVYTREEMERAGRLAERHDLTIISDEVYRDFVYEGGPPTSALQLDCADDRVVVVDSVSKRFSACGARVGFVITRVPDLMQAFMRMCFARLCPATVDQLAAVAAYDTPSSYFDQVRAEYRRRRDVLVDGLNRIPGVHTYRPHGAFYTMATFPVTDADAFCAWMLESFEHQGATVMMAPGSGFYGHPELGRQQARIAYVLEVSALQQSVEILAAALQVAPQRV